MSIHDSQHAVDDFFFFSGRTYDIISLKSINYTFIVKVQQPLCLCYCTMDMLTQPQPRPQIELNSTGTTIPTHNLYKQGT